MRHCVVYITLALFATAAWPQGKIFRCGNEYISSTTANEDADMAARGCKLIGAESKPFDPTARSQVQKRERPGVTIGMSVNEVLKSPWGRPLKIRRTTDASGAMEQWIYGSDRYLYFKNGVLTTIQN